MASATWWTTTKGAPNGSAFPCISPLHGHGRCSKQLRRWEVHSSCLRSAKTFFDHLFFLEQQGSKNWLTSWYLNQGCQFDPESLLFQRRTQTVSEALPCETCGCPCAEAEGKCSHVEYCNLVCICPFLQEYEPAAISKAPSCVILCYGWLVRIYYPYAIINPSGFLLCS